MKDRLGASVLAWCHLFLCVASSRVTPERLGMRLCMIQCLRYNRCFGVRMNVTTMTCTLLDDRHVVGEIMDASRNAIVQIMRTQLTCIASKHYKRLFCIVNNKGHSVDVTDQTASSEEEINYGALTFKKASLHNCRDVYGCLEILPQLRDSRRHVMGLVDRDILPGTRHLINMFPSFRPPSTGVNGTQWKLFTVAVTNTSSVNFNHMGWNITYIYDFTSRTYEAEYNNFCQSKRKTNMTKLDIFMLLDRSSAGDVILDVERATETIRESISGPNLNQPMWIAFRLYIAAKLRLYASFARPVNVEKMLYKWYQQQHI